MTRVIAAPPPEVITQLSELVTLILNADAVAKLVENMKAASDEYNQARLDYEVSISKSVLAKQDADKAAIDAENKSADAARKMAAHADSLAEVNAAKASLVNEKVVFDAVRKEFEETSAKAKADLDARELSVAAREVELENAKAEVVAIKESLDAKLAVLRA